MSTRSRKIIRRTFSADITVNRWLICSNCSRVFCRSLVICLICIRYSFTCCSYWSWKNSMGDVTKKRIVFSPFPSLSVEEDSVVHPLDRHHSVHFESNEICLLYSPEVFSLSARVLHLAVRFDCENSTLVFVDQRAFHSSTISKHKKWSMEQRRTMVPLLEVRHSFVSIE